MTENCNGKPEAGGKSGIERTVWRAGGVKKDFDNVAIETAVALVYNGISHVVMMATPTCLEDLALGFSLTEAVISSPSEIRDIDLIETSKGIEVSMTIAPEAFSKLKQRRRNLTGRTGCGLCGAESLEQVITAPKQVQCTNQISHQRIQQLIQTIDQSQQLQKVTGSVHGAAWFSNDGDLLIVREDVGRHNALDKLLGAYARAGLDNKGVLVITSRASYEMISKATWANIGIVVALSGPTSLAVDLAKQAGITLVGFCRYGHHAVYSHPSRLLDKIIL